ncbi:MAG: hypothetical protein AAB325_12335 [Pseudomonadota bacterium]
MAKPYGLLVAGFNYSNAAEDDFNAWYDTEHVPERLRTPGFINAQRWLGADDPKISIATYDLESLDVLQSPAYRAIGGVNLSPWSKHMTAKCQRICRFEAEQTLPGRQAAPADAGGMMMYAMNVPAEVDAEYNSWYNDEHIPALSAVPGCLCARRFKMAGGTHRYLSLYHLTAPEVQASDAWKKAAGTPWTAKMRPHFRDRLRLVLRRYKRKA